MALLKLFNRYPDRVGKGFTFAGTYTGPKSYATNGDPVQLPGFQNYIDSIENNGVLSVSGTYVFRAIPSAAGPRATWKLVWYSASAPQTEVTNATDLSAEKFIVSGLGGVY